MSSAQPQSTTTALAPITPLITSINVITMEQATAVIPPTHQPAETIIVYRKALIIIIDTHHAGASLFRCGSAQDLQFYWRHLSSSCSANFQTEPEKVLLSLVHTIILTIPTTPNPKTLL
jgi:hypothetical protein